MGLNYTKGNVRVTLPGTLHWLPSLPPSLQPQKHTFLLSPRFHLLVISSRKHYFSTWTKQGGGFGGEVARSSQELQQLRMRAVVWPKRTVVGRVPGKLRESSDLKGECRLKKVRGKVKGGGNVAEDQEWKYKARPSERAQGHVDERRRDTENVF